MRGTGRILIVDDQQADDIALLLRNGLKTVGEFVPVASPEEAIDAIGSETWSLMLLDFFLSGYSVVNGRRTASSPHGLDVLEAARKSELNANTPAILLSVDHDFISINGASDRSARILSKPFTLEQLLHAMAPLLTSTEEILRLSAAWCAHFKYRPRERELFQMKVFGAADVECADAMKIDIQTIESYRKHIVRKMDEALRVAGREEAPHFPDVLNIFYRVALGLRTDIWTPNRGGATSTP